MEDGNLWLAVWLIILIALSAYFSSTETAFSALNRIRIKNMASEGNKRAKTVLKLSEDYDKLLSTILIGNNIVNIAASSLATVFFVGLLGNSGVTVATVVMTVVVLIFGEISPKSLAKESPEKFAMFSAPVLNLLTVILTPVNFLFAKWKLLLGKIFKSSNELGITEREILTMVEEAEQEGGIGASESELIRSAIEFNDLDAEDILTPRVEVTAFDIESSIDELAELFVSSGYSRLPVYKDSIDTVLGFVNQKDFFAFCIRQDKDVESIVKPVLFVSPSIKISKLIRHLQKEKTHIAVVTDEYGGTMGIVTLEDILEELVGDIWDEHDEIIVDIRKVGKDDYVVKGSADIDDVMDLFGLDCDDDVNTIGGFITERLEKMPQKGDSFEYEGVLITVLQSGGRKIEKARLRRVANDN